MSITLNPTLLTAMQDMERRPLVEIISKEDDSSIPFDGAFLDNSIELQKSPCAILHSSGRILHAIFYGTSGVNGSHIRFRYSDTERTVFTVVDLLVDISTTSIGVDLAMVEMADGNVGIVFSVAINAGALAFNTMIVTDTGIVVTAPVANNYKFFGGNANYTLVNAGPALYRTASGTYVVVYFKCVSGSPNNTYSMHSRTSSDFITWSAESTIAFTVITATNRIGNPFLFKPLETNEVWLLFDYSASKDAQNNELSNIYCAISQDECSSFAEPAALTAYQYYKQVAKHPVVTQKSSTTMHLVYDEWSGCIHIDKDTLNFDNGANCTNLTFDSANRKLYVTNYPVYVYSGDFSVISIGVDDWAVSKRYDKVSSPALPAGRIIGSATAFSATGEGQYHVVMGANVFTNTQDAIVIVNGEDDTVIEIYPDPLDPTCNVTGLDITEYHSSGFIEGVCIDEQTNRIYVLMYQNGTTEYGSKEKIFGYFSLTEAGGVHTWNEIFREETLKTAQYQLSAFYYECDQLYNGAVKVWPSLDIVTINYDGFSGGGYGALKIYSLSSGGHIKTFKNFTHANFPVSGLTDLTIVNGMVYGIQAQSSYSGGAALSFCIIDINSELVLVNDWPTAYTAGGYTGGIPRCISIEPVDSNRIMVVEDTTIGIYTINNQQWQVFNSDNVPGMRDLGGRCFRAAYDATTDMIYVAMGEMSFPDYTYGVTAFSIWGVMKQSQYKVGTNAGATWEWAVKDNLVQGYHDNEASMLTVIDDEAATATMYAFWTRVTGLKYEAVWDKEDVEMNLKRFLSADDDVTLRRTIDSEPAKLTFSVSHGHLFDVYNTNSLLAPYLSKGRTLTLRYGELIGGVEYWQAMGTFRVTGQAITYQRKLYPLMTIEAQDRSVYWEDEEITASELWNGAYPETILRDALLDHGGIADADIILGTWANTRQLTHQWIETDLKTLIEDLQNRFGYYLRIDINNDVVSKRLTDQNAVDVTYANVTKIVNFSPDDGFANRINRVIVKGTERTAIEVTYDEEAIKRISGTVQYNTGTEDIYVYYSEDRSRKCRYPRLEVIKTSTSIGFMLSGDISESISYVDPLEYYCIVTVDAPDLTTLLIISLAAMLASLLLPDWAIVVGLGASTGYTIRIGTWISSFFTWTTLQILAATGTWEYQIWACPIGTVYRSVQAEANDATNQVATGKVLTKVIEDPFCYTVLDCMEVAEQELLVAKLQKQRCKFEMLADIRNEDGDTIQILHPHSLNPLKIFITDLERVMHKGETFVDKVEGWVLD